MSLGKIIVSVLAALGAGGAAAIAYAAIADNTAEDDSTGEPADHLFQATGTNSPQLGVRAVQVLQQFLGQHGDGPKGTPGYHRNGFIDTVMRGYYNDEGDKLLGLAWCSRAVRYAFENAAADLNLGKIFPDKLGALSMAESWKKSPFDKFLLGSAKVGAVFVIKTSVGFHTGLVVQVLGPLTAITIEGNHNDSVAAVKRTFDLSKDALVDVEAWVKAQMQNVVGGGLDDFA